MQKPVEVRYAGIVVGRSSDVRDATGDGFFLGLPDPMPVGTLLELRLDERTAQARIERVTESPDATIAGVRFRVLENGAGALLGIAMAPPAVAEPVPAPVPEPVPAPVPALEAAVLAVAGAFAAAAAPAAAAAAAAEAGDGIPAMVVDHISAAWNAGDPVPPSTDSGAVAAGESPSSPDSPLESALARASGGDTPPPPQSQPHVDDGRYRKGKKKRR